jgi:hypothetical protein
MLSTNVHSPAKLPALHCLGWTSFEQVVTLAVGRNLAAEWQPDAIDKFGVQEELR